MWILAILLILATPKAGAADAQPSGSAADTLVQRESWDDIDPGEVNRLAVEFPLSHSGGPGILQTQIMLDRVHFSPGEIDGWWGRNTKSAVYWFQQVHGLSATGEVDRETFERLREESGDAPLVVRHVLQHEDVEGPFVSLPDGVYASAEMECMCFESLPEKLGERFQTSPELLAKLNADVELNDVQARDSLWVPAVDRSLERDVEVAQIVVSDPHNFVQALDDEGQILFHFPSTLGSSYDPSPSGEHHIEAIAFDPSWHYQPDLLDHVDDSKDDAILPPGPNNAVGVVWMDLSKPHYGIHGTDAPETIGYANSAGCVRLTNWDAQFLAEQVEPGVPVLFEDYDSNQIDRGS